MFTPEFTATFERELEKIKKRGKDMQKIKDAVLLLCSENPLPPRYRDHALKGRFEGYRECHLEFDWLLIYKKDRGRLLLFLTHTGTHADLFGE